MVRQPALKAAILYAGGIAVARLYEIPLIPLILVFFTVTITALLSVISDRWGKARSLLTASSLFLLGSLTLSLKRDMAPRDDLRRFLDGDRNVTFIGRVCEEPVDRGERREFIVKADSLFSGQAHLPARGKVLVYSYVRISGRVSLGDRILIGGTVRPPPAPRNPGEFDYRAYLATRGIHAVLYQSRFSRLRIVDKKEGNSLYGSIIIPLRRSMRRVFLEAAGPTAASFLNAVILGDRSSLTPDLRENFARAGVVHILAVSGLHVGFVLLIISGLGLLLRLNRHWRLGFTLAALGLYVLLTGAKPPVVRASLMGALYLCGGLLERKTDPLNLIGVAALLLLFLNPDFLFDAGFQLSFGAMLGILLLYPRLAALRLFREKTGASRYLTAALLVSLTAQIGTLPLTLFYFQRLPLLSLVTNLIAIPLAGLVTALGFTTWFASLVSSWLASIYGGLTREVISLLTFIVARVSGLSFASITFPQPSLWTVLEIYLALAAAVAWPKKRLRLGLIYTFLLIISFQVWRGAIDPPGRTLRWLQFDVGQGDAALLRLPRGKAILIDGGDRTASFDYGERVILPYLRREGIKKLDLVIVSHPHNDHIGGLAAVIKSVRIGRIIVPNIDFPTQLYRELLSRAGERQIPVTRLAIADTVGLPGVRILLRQPFRQPPVEKGLPDANNMSIVAKVMYGGIALLFLGDAERKAEQLLLAQQFPLRADGVKIGHHGSSTSSSLPFIDRIGPGQAVISVGAGNRYGHPSEQVIRRLQENGMTVLRTDQEGALLFRSDGTSLRRVYWR